MTTQAALPQVRPATVAPNETQPSADQLISYAGLVEIVEKWSQDPRVSVSVAGTSHCGRSIFVGAISLPENLAAWSTNRRRIHEIWNQMVRYPTLDSPHFRPDLEALQAVKPSLLLHAGSFGFEASHTEAACELVAHLLSSDDSEVATILQNSVVLVMPMVNPDSRELALEQWSKYQLAPGWLGAGNSYGFLMNRDFYALSQPENQAVHRVMNDWHPLMALDTHEDMAFLGARRDEKCWVPPFRQPRHGNLEKKITDIVDEFSAAIANRWRREGFTVWYEPEGSFISFLVLDGRCDIHFDLHGIPCLFTESGRTPGGQSWQDRNRQKVLAALTFFHKAATEYSSIMKTEFDHWNEQIQTGIAEPPVAFLIPRSSERARDPETTNKLISVLLSHEIQVYTVEKPFPVFVVPLGQPNRPLILAMLDVQPWNLMSLPPAMGVECITLESLPSNKKAQLRKADLRPISEIHICPARVQVATQNASPVMALKNTESSLPVVNRALEVGAVVRWSLSAVSNNSRKFAAGTYFIEDQRGTMQQVARQLGVSFCESTWSPRSHTHVIKRFNIALYLGQGADEKNLCSSGEAMWALDRLGFTWTGLTEEDIHSGNLKQFDVFIVPSGSAPEMLNGWDTSAQNYSKPWQAPGTPKGLGKKGIAKIVDFIRQGGRYIGLGAGGALACKELGAFADVSIVDQGLGQARVYLDIKLRESPILFGYTGFRDQNGHWHANEMPAFYYCDLLWPRMDNYSGPVFKPGVKATALATFKRVDYEEWTEHLERAPRALTQNYAAIVYQPISKGSVVLLGINLGFRGQWISNYKLLANAIMSWNIRANK